MHSYIMVFKIINKKRYVINVGDVLNFQGLRMTFNHNIREQPMREWDLS